MLHDAENRFSVSPFVQFDLPDRRFLIGIPYGTGVADVSKGRSFLSRIGELKQLDEFWMTQVQRSAFIAFQSLEMHPIHPARPSTHIHRNE